MKWGCGCSAIGCLGLGAVIGAVLMWYYYRVVEDHQLTREHVSEELEWVKRDAAELGKKGKALLPESK